MNEASLALRSCPSMHQKEGFLFLPLLVPWKHQIALYSSQYPLPRVPFFVQTANHNIFVKCVQLIKMYIQLGLYKLVDSEI